MFVFSSRRRHTRCALVTGVQTCALPILVVFDGPEDYHARIEDPALDIDERTILVIRGAGPVGYPGGAEVVNMRPPAALIRAGVHNLPCIGDGRQSGTIYSPSHLNAAPEAAVGGGPAQIGRAHGCTPV